MAITESSRTPQGEANAPPSASWAPSSPAPSTEVPLTPQQPARAASYATPRPPQAERGGWGWLALLIPMLFCCGGPLIIGALAAASAATLGLAGGVIGAVLLAVAVLWWMRRRRRAEACCSPLSQGWNQ